MARTTRRSTSALLVGVAFIASLAFVSPAGAAPARGKATTVASHQPAKMAKVGAIQGRMSIAT